MLRKLMPIQKRFIQKPHLICKMNRAVGRLLLWLSVRKVLTYHD